MVAWRPWAGRYGGWLLGLGSLGMALPADAQSGEADLRDLLARQAALIAALQARVAALEGQHPAATAPAAPAIAVTAPPQATAIDWSAGGPTFALGDGRSFHVRGRVHVDASATTGSRFADRNLDGTQLNSARLGADGTWNSHIGYKVEVELDGNAVSLKETYLSWEGRWGGRQVQVFVGNKTGDRSIDGASYDDFVPFFQRSMLATAVGPEKGIMGLGVLAKLAGPDWHIGLDVVGNDPNAASGTASDAVSFIARGTWTPAIARDTRLHLGLWVYQEDIARGSITQITRNVDPGESFNQNLHITTSPILNPRASNGQGAEIGLLQGSFWTFGEVGRRHILADGGSRIWSSWLAEAGFFLTGERPNFSPAYGAWTQLRPEQSVFQGGRGAIELLARYESTSLGVAQMAGSGQDLTLGADWYLSGNLRVLADWVHWQVRNPAAPYAGFDRGDTFNLRFDTTF